MTIATTQEALDTVAGRAPSLAEMFYRRVEMTPDREAFRFPDQADAWASRTWSQTQVLVDEIAAGVIAVGIRPEDRVAIASSSRFEWIIADLAVNCAAASTTTIYPSTIAEEVAFIVSDSQSRLVFAEDDTQIEKLRSHRDEIPTVELVVTFDGTADGEWVITLDELAERGRALLQEQASVVRDRSWLAGPDTLATLVYTSGTTGRPKGVRLTNDAWTYMAASISAVPELLREDDVNFLWLPLAHVFGKVLIASQLQIGFVTAVDGRVPRIMQNIAEVKPTFMGSAPRIFEKIYSAVNAQMREAGGATLEGFRWAEQVGADYVRRVHAGSDIPEQLREDYARADALVFAKLRDRLGGRIRIFLSGSAALNRDVLEWFHAVGLPVMESYGMTETTAGVFVNSPSRMKLGTVGSAFPGLDAKVADDGELLVRGPGITQGYHNLPDATREAFDEEGWLHTGDIGAFDDEGFFTVTDRKKDLFKTSGGKYVAPARIESSFKGICPLASQMLVHGDGRNYCTALISLDPDALRGRARGHGLPDATYAELATSPEVHEEIAADVARLNATLNPWETIKKFVILDTELTVDSGELTPSLKMKRAVVEANHRALLDTLYT